MPLTRQQPRTQNSEFRENPKQQQPRMQSPELQNFQASCRCQLYASMAITHNNASAISDQCPYGDSQAWSEKKIRKVLSKAFQHVQGGLHLWKKNSMVLNCA